MDSWSSRHGRRRVSAQTWCFHISTLVSGIPLAFVDCVDHFFSNLNYMTTIPKTLTYEEFLNKVGTLDKADSKGAEIFYHDLFRKVKSLVGDKPIATLSDFKQFTNNNLGNIDYKVLYERLYNKKGGKRKSCKSKSTRRRRK